MLSYYCFGLKILILNGSGLQIQTSGTQPNIRWVGAKGTAWNIRWVGNGHQCSVNIRWVGTLFRTNVGNYSQRVKYII